MDGGAEDRAAAPRWDHDHLTIGAPDSLVTFMGLSVVNGTEELHLLDRGLPAPRPGGLAMVPLAPIGRPVAAWPDAASITLGQRPAQLGGRGPPPPPDVKWVAVLADQDGRERGVAGQAPKRRAADREAPVELGGGGAEVAAERLQ